MSAMELEILEFKSGGNSYGIRVSDIREILPYKIKPTPVPNAHPYVEGIIIPRDFVIPIVSSLKVLELQDVNEVKKEMLIVTSYLDMNIALRVDSVKGIHRVLEDEIKKTDKKLTTKHKDRICGVIEKDALRIEIIDMKQIIGVINPEIKFA